MSAPHTSTLPQHGHGHTHTHDAHDHHEPGFWQKYIFSTDHKVIGIQYGVTALSFLFFGFLLMICMRYQISHPGEKIPIAGPILEFVLGSDAAGGGKMSADLYNFFV